MWLQPGQKSDHPFLKGGQAVAQWREVEPAEGKYDFSGLDRQIEALEKLGRSATVQINGNQHPEWLFSRVPYLEKKLSPQVRDERGTLAYWHPVYRQAYRRLVQALGLHLRNSPSRDAVLGVRLNFNAIGTEHSDVPEEFRDPALWTVPQSTPVASRWTRESASEYRAEVVDNFVESVIPAVRVFLRNNVAAAPELLEQGRLALFHTSSEMEPRTGNESQYELFLRYCRSGKTACYAEPWADAQGNHGGQRDSRWCSPEQFNYWRLLSDLHYGVSFLAIYGSDLARAGEPEFGFAFEFAARYAGFHASPSQAPGAWIALREGNYLKGDYSFLMSRLGELAGVEKAGPSEQRFGAWARALAAGKEVGFRPDAAFAASLTGPATLNVTYLDRGQGGVDVRYGGSGHRIALEDSGSWKTASFSVETAKGDITIRADNRLVLHLIEVRR